MDLKSLEFIRVELSDQIAELRISRPKALNAINVQVVNELKTALEELGSFSSLACMILTGEGDKAFVAGADIAEMRDMSPEQAKALSVTGHAICEMLATFPVPVLAAVNGYALGGGCELAAACDIVYASSQAKFGQPEVKLGLIPGFGGTVRLPLKIGIAAASEWIYTGGIYSAEQAQALGLVREVLPPDELLDRVRAVAKTIAQRAPLAIRAAKKIISQQPSLSFADAIELEQTEFAGMFATEDMREGTTAFVDKRDPRFTGK